MPDQTEKGIDLLIALAMYDFEAAIALIDDGADIHIADTFGCVLHHAIAVNAARVVEILIKKGVSLSIKNIHGDSPLAYACKLNSFDAAQVLIDNGADVNVIIGDEDKTILHTATENGNIKVVDFLLKNKKTSLDIVDVYGKSALHYAAEAHGFYGNARFLIGFELLRRGANKNLQDEKGCTPLHIAVKTGNKCMAEALIGSGALIAAKTEQGETVFHLAAKKNKKEIMSVLLKQPKPEDMNNQDLFLNTPLHYAVIKKQVQVVCDLCLKGADLNLKNCNGETPLYVASRMGSDIIVQYLLSLPGVQVNDIGEFSLLAFYQNNPVMKNSLISKGVSETTETTLEKPITVVGFLERRKKTVSFVPDTKMDRVKRYTP